MLQTTRQISREFFLSLCRVFFLFLVRFVSRRMRIVLRAINVVHNTRQDEISKSTKELTRSVLTVCCAVRGASAYT